jgi:hypothetical protein
MDATFFDYLQRLEILAFFSGYPLIYALVFFVFGNKKSKSVLSRKIPVLLQYTYAFVGTLFLGLQLNNLYPDYSIENIQLAFQEPYLKIWGFLSLLFWIPALSKKTIFSLFHSLVFFFLLVKDLFMYLIRGTGQSMIKNEMKIYSDSLLLNVIVLIAMIIIYNLFIRFKTLKKSTSGL